MFYFLNGDIKSVEFCMNELQSIFGQIHHLNVILREILKIYCELKIYEQVDAITSRCFVRLIRSKEPQLLMLLRSPTSLDCSEEPRARPSSMIIDLPVISKGWSSLDESTGELVKRGEGWNIKKKGHYCKVNVTQNK